MFLDAIMPCEEIYSRYFTTYSACAKKDCLHTCMFDLVPVIYLYSLMILTSEGLGR
jgi:hypothetical protein